MSTEHRIRIQKIVLYTAKFLSHVLKTIRASCMDACKNVLKKEE
jgi:hypothetical protein